MPNEDVLQHFNKEEAPFIDQVLDWRTQVINQYRPVLTPFLNPREQVIVNSLLGHSDDYDFAFFGGHEHAERCRVLIYPPYFEIKKDDFEIMPLSIHYASKFNQLAHRQILGSLLETGIDRNRIGDIISEGDTWQLFVDKTLVDFLKIEVTKMGRTPVTLKMIANEKEILNPPSQWQMSEQTISSYRLDTVLAEGFHLSRTKTKQAIEKGGCKINWQAISNPSHEVKIGDIISLRGHGRLKLSSELLITKKGNYRVKIGRIKNN